MRRGMGMGCTIGNGRRSAGDDTVAVESEVLEGEEGRGMVGEDGGRGAHGDEGPY